MTVFPLLAVGFIMKVVAALFIVCCVSLILIILIQKGRGGGLSGAFGGAMAGGILGSKTGDFLTWVTIVLVGVFLTLAVLMAKFYRPDVSEFGEDEPARQELPASPEQPSASAGVGQTTSDVNAAADVNSPGG
jgi:preprotein translocase subunit SecG